MEEKEIKKLIDKLIEIHEMIQDNEFDTEWALPDDLDEELWKITGAEEYDWDADKLAHYISGMQRALQLTNKTSI